MFFSELDQIAIKKIDQKYVLLVYFLQTAVARSRLFYPSIHTYKANQVEKMLWQIFVDQMTYLRHIYLQDAFMHWFFSHTINWTNNVIKSK